MKHKEIIELLNEMTIEEKIAQIIQITGDVFLSDDIDCVLTGPLKNLHLPNEMLYNIGSVLNIIGAEKVKKVQDEYDPLLGKIYAKTIVKAYQGKKLSETGKIAACVKHIAGYGVVEVGREYNTVDMSEREFRQYYLPAYKSAIEEGAEMLMTSFNILNGIPATVNTWLIQEIIRKELGFKGIIISDYGAIEETIIHGYSMNEKEKRYLMNSNNLERAKKLTQETFVLLKNKNHIYLAETGEFKVFVGGDSVNVLEDGFELDT